VKVSCRKPLLPVVALTAAVMIAGCPLPFEYNGPGSGTSHTTDPSSPSITAPVTVSYSVQGGPSGTVGDGGSFYAGDTMTVTLSTATVSALIFYTDDGTPLALTGLGSAKKISASSGELTITRATTLQSLDIRAIAIGPNMLPSAVVHATVGVSPFPILSITRNNAFASEDGGTATFTITSSSAPAGDITVNLATSGDYEPGDVAGVPGSGLPLSVTLLAGATTTTIAITGQPDADLVNDTVTLTIQAGSTTPPLYTVGAPASASVVIQDNQTPKYTVMYDGNGNTGGTVPTDSNTYLQGAPVIVKGNTGSLVRTAYAFTGWNTQAGGGGTTYTVGATFPMGTSNVTLYAVWTPTYTVMYDGNGSTGGTVPTDSNSYLQGAMVIVKGNTGSLVRTAYAFTGWNTQAGGGGTTYTGGATFPMGTSNVTLYAVWTPTYTVTYNGNLSTGGTVPTDSNSYLSGATVTVKNPGTMVRAGFTFNGWNTAADGTGTPRAAGSTMTMGSANVTLYAMWIRYFVTYNGNGNDGGAVPSDGTGYPTGGTVTVLGAGTLSLSTGFFVGWNTAANGSGTTYLGGQTFSMGSANVTLYAMWAIVTGTTLTSVPLNATNVVVPEGVTDIGTALRDLPNLVSVTLPSTLATITLQALYVCPQLTTIISNSTRFQVINGALVDTATNRLIQVPVKLSGAFAIPPGITNIDAYAFGDCASLTSISIPASLTTISGNGFSGLHSNIPIVLPSTVTNIGAYAFIYSWVTSITIPASVTFIGTKAMTGCSYLTNVYMASSTPPTLGAADVFSSSSPTVHVPNAAALTAYLADPTWLATGVSIVTP
jgi:uncharacterized repeat protein (TIGR02543 family)